MSERLNAHRLSERRLNERWLFRWLLIALAFSLAGHVVIDLAGLDSVRPQIGMGRTESSIPLTNSELSSGSLHTGVTLPPGPALATPIGLCFALVATAVARTTFRLRPRPEPPRFA